MELEKGLPFQTRRIKGWGIAKLWIVGLKDIEDVLVAGSRSSLGQAICRESHQRESIKDASEAGRKRPPR